MRSHFLVLLMHWSPSPHNISELLHFGLLFWQSISSEESPQSSRPLHVHFILVQFPLLQVNLSDVHVMLASGKKDEKQSQEQQGSTSLHSLLSARGDGRFETATQTHQKSTAKHPWPCLGDIS